MFHISNYFHNYEYKTRGIILLNEKDQFVCFLTKYSKYSLIKYLPPKKSSFKTACFLFEHVYQDDGAFALKEDHHLTKSLRFHSSGKYILKINFKNVKKK